MDLARASTAARASLRARAGLLRLRLGDTEGALARLNDAHAELEHAVGPEANFENESSPENEKGEQGGGSFDCKVAFRELREAMDAARAPAATAQQALEVSTVVRLFLDWNSEQKAVRGENGGEATRPGQ